jgi:hypothetical protein
MIIERIKSELELLGVILLIASFFAALVAGKLCPLTVKVRGKIAALLWELRIVLIIDVLVLAAFIGLQAAGIIPLKGQYHSCLKRLGPYRRYPWRRNEQKCFGGNYDPLSKM